MVSAMMASTSMAESICPRSAPVYMGWDGSNARAWSWEQWEGTGRACDTDNLVGSSGRAKVCGSPLHGESSSMSTDAERLEELERGRSISTSWDSFIKCTGEGRPCCSSIGGRLRFLASPRSIDIDLLGLRGRACLASQLSSPPCHDTHTPSEWDCLASNTHTWGSPNFPPPLRRRGGAIALRGGFEMGFISSLLTTLGARSG